MASGPVCRANRPNTWLHRPAMRRDDFPCQLGAVHTWHLADVRPIASRGLVRPKSGHAVLHRQRDGSPRSEHRREVGAQ
jgi:hypothetical protein